MARFSVGKLISCRWAPSLLAVAWLLTSHPVALAQIVQRQVGGVWIDADGILRNQDRDETNALKAKQEIAAQAVPGDLNEKSDLRKVSLRRLEAAIAETETNGNPLPDEIKYLAGMERVQYVFVYPEQQDIVIAGPGEGWKINAQGEVVGKTSGKPVLLLDDLLVALRTASRARRESISCSIEPTAEGLSRLKAIAKSLRQGEGVLKTIEDTLGMQTISVTGVPADSHFARVIVAADYKMKRLAMNFDKSPVRGMPSYMEMIGAGPKGMNNMLPRWWLAPNYDSLLTDGEGTAWEFRAAGVKCVAEEDFMNASGERVPQTKQSGPIKKWADTMTAKYEELSAKDVVFGQLRNCIDLAVVAALITKEHLDERAGHSFSLLMDESQLPTEQFHAPTQVPSKASVVRKGSTWVISASGGVQIDAWSLAEKAEANDAVAPARKQAESDTNLWWWN